MARKYIPLFLIFAFLQTSLYAQSLNYSGVNNFDLATSTHIGEYGVPSLERRPTGMIYGDNGNKLYVVGSIGDFVIQYDLSTAYDLSSRSSIQSYFRVNAEDTNPEDVLFNDTGTKMYILGGAGDDVTEYTLSTAWDLYSIDTTTNVPVVFNAEAAIDTYLSPTTSHGDNLTGFRFNDDGTKLFILDRSADRVFEFSLETAYDISTSGVVDADISVSALENNGRAMEFNNDGTELYVIGYSGDDVNTYNFSTGYDLTSFTSSSTSIALAEGEPNLILINDDGTTFYIGGFIDQEIKEYSLGTAYDFSSTITLDDTYAAPTIERTPHGMVFNNDGSKLFTVGSTLDMVSEISLSVSYDISTGNLTNGLYINTEENNATGLAFNSSGTVLYVIGNDDDGINQYALSSAFDLSSTITHSGPFSVNILETNSENSPRDLVFNGDGSKLFVLGNRRDRVFQFNLSTNYDLSALATDYVGEYNLNSVDTAPQGLAFNNDGTKFYIAGNSGDDINEFTITSAYDLTTGTITNTNTFSVATEELTILDVVFNNDGSRFYIVGSDGDNMNQYYTKGMLPETPNDGSVDFTSNTFLITLTGDTFFASSGNFTDTEVTISGVPEGLTAVLTLNSNTEAELSFTGKAGSHLNSDETAANLSFTFLDAAFTTSNAADVTNAIAHTDVIGFDFIECADDEIVYNGGWTGGNNAGVPDNSATDLAKGIRVQGDITVTANTNCDCLNIESGQTLTIADGVELTVTNALELDGDLRLLGSAQLIQTHTGSKNSSGAGNLYKSVMGTLENVYQSGYWSSPVTTNGVTYNIAGVLKDGSETLTASNSPLDITFSGGFDGAPGTVGVTPITLSTRWLATFKNSSGWTTQIDESTELLNPGEGFNKKSTGQSGGQNYIFIGRPNDGEYTHTIDAYGSGIWSLLGNPYSSPLDIDQFTTDNATAIEGSIYFYESGTSTSTHNGGAYTGGYATRFMGAGNSAYDNDNALVGLEKIPGQYIGVGQGFFVEASGVGGTITFNNSQREFNTPNEFFSKVKSKNKSTSFPIIRIGFEFLNNGKTYHRPVTVGFRDFINSPNEYKGAEMWDYNPTDMALRLNDKESPYSITMIEDFNLNLTIPIKVSTDSNREVSFILDELLNVETDVYLYDSTNEIYYNLIKDKVSINLDSGTYENRFYITFKNSTLYVEEIINNNIFIKHKDDLITVNSKDILESVYIYNLLGQNIFKTKNIKELDDFSINTKEYKSGVYLIKVKTTKGYFSKKIIIN